MRRRSLAIIGTIGMLAVAGVTGYAAAAQKQLRSRSFTTIIKGARISTGDYVFKVVSSLDGTGAAITHVTSSTPTAFPDVGSSVTTIYFRDGVSKQRISFKQYAPGPNGVSRFTGHGKCSGGTGVHKAETCTYTLTGTYNVTANENDVKITGTDTR